MQQSPGTCSNAGNAEAYDIFTKSVIYGIHSPWNYHSYKQAFLFLPQKCAMCNLTIYPSVMFTMSGGSSNSESGFSCLRCNSFAHRKCIRKRTLICGSQVKTGTDNVISTSNKESAKSSLSREDAMASHHTPARSFDSNPSIVHVDWAAISENWSTGNSEKNDSSDNTNKEIAKSEDKGDAQSISNHVEEKSEKERSAVVEKDWAVISEIWQSNTSIDTDRSYKSLPTYGTEGNNAKTMEEKEAMDIVVSEKSEDSNCVKVEDISNNEGNDEAAGASIVTYENIDIPKDLASHEEVFTVPPIQVVVNDTTPTKTYEAFSNNIDNAISAASPILADIGSLIMVNLNNVVATTSAHMNSVSQNINNMRVSTFDRLRRSSFLNSSDTIEIVVNKYSADIDFDSVLLGDSSDTGDLSIMTSECLPPPGSEKCVWRHALIRLFKSRKKCYVLKDIPDDMIEIQETVTSLLNGSRSFSNRVAMQMHSMYVDLVFDLPSDSLKHARECLDCISSAVLSQLPDNIINRPNSKDIIRSLTTAVDKYVLTLGYKNAMYNKSFSAAIMECQSSDEALIARYSSYTNVIESETQDMTIDIMNACDEKLRRVVQSTVASEKLGHLTHVLEIAVSAGAVNGSSDLDVSGAENESGGRFIGADVLLQRLRFLIKRNIHLHKTNWNAEIIYITAMLNDFNDIMLGKEGYSFVSLQQCVDSLNKM